MRIKPILLIIIVLFSGCKAIKNSTEEQINKIANPIATFKTTINNELIINSHSAATLDIDLKKKMSSFSFGTEHLVNRDNQINVFIKLILNSTDYKIEPREYGLKEFQPSCSHVKFNYEKDAYINITYKPIEGKMIITEYDSINQDYYIISGSFEFVSINNKNADTVTVDGIFKNMPYNFYYRDLNYFQEFINKN